MAQTFVDDTTAFEVETQSKKGSKLRRFLSSMSLRKKSGGATPDASTDIVADGGISEATVDKEIKKKMKSEQKHPPFNVLLLGAGGSGKSTVRKQMEYVSYQSVKQQSMPEYGATHPTSGMNASREEKVPLSSPREEDDEDELKQNNANTSLSPISDSAIVDEAMVRNILEDLYKHILFDIVDLCNSNIEYQSAHLNAIEAGHLSSEEEKINPYALENEETEQLLLYIRSNIVPTDDLTPEIAEMIHKLWKDTGMKATFDRRKRYHVMDNTPYFLGRVQEIARIDFQPSWHDWLSIRSQTTGFVTCDLVTYDGENHPWKFKITDCGGQRNERKKWFKLLAMSSDIDVCVWVMALSAYDQVLFEDHTQKCFDESLQLFSTIVHHHNFKNVDFYVFLNKRDVFLEKIKSIPFSAYDPNFATDACHDADAIEMYVRSQFADIFKEPNNKYAKFAPNQNRYLRTSRVSGAVLPNSTSNDNIDPLSNDPALAGLPVTSSSSSSGRKRTRQLFFHNTCATDVEQMAQIIQLVELSTVRKRLETMGMM